jgi:hypothetical protein
MNECFLTFFLPIAFATGVANAIGVLSNLVPAGPKHAGMVVDVQQIKLARISLAWISHHHFVGKEDAQLHNSTTKSHHILRADKPQTLVGERLLFSVGERRGEQTTTRCRDFGCNCHLLDRSGNTQLCLRLRVHAAARTFTSLRLSNRNPRSPLSSDSGSDEDDISDGDLCHGSYECRCVKWRHGFIKTQPDSLDMLANSVSLTCSRDWLMCETQTLIV